MTAIHAKVHISPITPMPSAPTPPPRKQAEPKADKIVMTCEKCSYRARIPVKYIGISIHCPNCNAINVPKADDGRDATPKKGPSERTPAVGGMPFACAQCGYSGRISASIASGIVSCPACRAPQSIDADQAPRSKAVAPGIAASALVSKAKVAPESEPDLDSLFQDEGPLEEQIEQEESEEPPRPAPPATRRQTSSRRLAMGKRKDPDETDSDVAMLDDLPDNYDSGPSFAHSPSVRHFVQLPHRRRSRAVIVGIMIVVTGAAFAGIWYYLHREGANGVAPNSDSAYWSGELGKALQEKDALQREMEQLRIEMGQAELRRIMSPSEPTPPPATTPRFNHGNSRAPYDPAVAAPAPDGSTIMGDGMEPDELEPVY
jgi:hypothetical protein